MSTNWDVFTCERCGKAFVNDRGGQPRHCVGCALKAAAEAAQVRSAAGGGETGDAGLARANGPGSGALSRLRRGVNDLRRKMGTVVTKEPTAR